MSDDLATLDAQYGLGGGTGAPAPGPQATDLASLDKQYGLGGPKPETSAEQRSREFYGQHGITSDAARSFAHGTIKGLINMLGIPGTLQVLAEHAAGDNKAEYQGTSPYSSEVSAKLPTGADIRSAIESLVGQPLYEPQTTPGKYAGAAGEGVGGLPVAPGLGAVSGVGGEVGKEIAGPWGQFIGSLVTGGLYALAKFFLSSTPSRQIANALQGVTDDQLKQANDLMQQAEAAGTKLTADEAINQVTGGNTRLTNMRRVVENSPQGAEAFESVTGPRAAANDVAMRETLDKVGPTTAEPTEVAPRVQAVAKDTVQAARDETNAASKPFYDASTNNPNSALPANDFTALVGDKAVAHAIKAVKGDPVKYGDLSALPDNSGPVLDAAKKYLDDVANAAKQSGENFAATNAGKAAGKISEALDAAMPDYGTARAVQTSGRRNFEEPLQRSPIGQLAEADKFPAQAKIIFETNPLPGSERQIADAVRTVASSDPEAARTFVRLKLEQAFNEVTQQLTGGANKFGGAGYAATMTGNPQQAKNLRAAIEALPDGAEAGRAFFNLMRIFKAQGTAPRAGSMTAFNEEIQAELSKGGTVGELFRAATAPAKTLYQGASEALSRAYYNRNVSRLADILTSPNAIEQMRTIAKIGPDSPQARALFGLLVVGTENAPEAKQ